MNSLVYALTLFVTSPAPVEPVELGRYHSAVECDIAVRTVKIQHRGARLRCLPQAPMVEERQAQALARSFR